MQIRTRRRPHCDRSPAQPAAGRGIEGLRPAASPGPESGESNIELHDRLVAAVVDREIPGGLLAPDFHMENHVAASIDYSYSGAGGWEDWLGDLFEVFAEGARYRSEEILAVGEDFVAATFCVDGPSVRSGNWLEFRWVGVTWFRAGKAVRIVGYSSRGAALRSVELRSRARAGAHDQAASHATEILGCDDPVSPSDRGAPTSLTPLRPPDRPGAEEGTSP